MGCELELRNVPRPQVIQYLIEAGGQQTGDLVVAGDDWHAQLHPMEPAIIGVMSIRRDMLVIEGTPEEADRVCAHMRRRTMRGGG